SVNNHISNNNIYNNGGLSIDLGDNGRSNNDNDDTDTGANNFQNFPIILETVLSDDALTVTGFLNSTPNQTYTLEFFASESCVLFGGGEQTYLGNGTASTDADGNTYFSIDGLAYTADGSFITVTATDNAGNTSELSDCFAVGPNNTSWPAALELNIPADMNTVAYQQHLLRFGESRWYKFPVQANSKVIVTLTNLPANYDLTIYKDISQAYNDLQGPQDLNILGAEFAPEAFSPEAFSPEAFSPEAFSPEAFSPEAFSPEAFSGAQLRALLGVSAFRGTASEGLIVNTWNNTGFFYVRVRGSNGAFNLASPFDLSVTILSNNCESVAPSTVSHSFTVDTSASYETLILTDMNRMVGTAAEKAALQANLELLKIRPEVKGNIIAVGNDAQVADLNLQAQNHPACPYAKNLVAQSIKDIINAYKAVHPIKYVVIVGGDNVIPFFRYPDNALLANENNFNPYLLPDSPSQATLRLGYVMGQDEYGSEHEISFKSSAIPVPNLYVGRLVETAAQVNNYLGAYFNTADGVVQPQNDPLITGYDFLEDVALAVQEQLELGTNLPSEALISPSHLAPYDPQSWTAADLRDALLNGRNDITFLAGHFSASGALAADYSTRMTAAELMNAPINLQNVLVYSAGCHSGYNLIDEHGIPAVTEHPDWAQAFNYKGTTFVGGTGYQYGDTEFIEYSERLYLEFTKQLRTGTGPVPVGQALAIAKQIYLAETPQMRGIHEKSLIEATLFGLPMFSIDMQGVRLPDNNNSSDIGSTTSFSSDPGHTLGLSYADYTLVPDLALETMELTNVVDDSTVTASYLTGSDGIVTNPAEPTLPLEMINATVPNQALRGIGFRGGSYTDLGGITPLTGAATTELRGVHAPFQVNFFYPVQMWRANYFESIATNSDTTRIAVTPAQFMSDDLGSLTGIMRRYDALQFRFYYSDEIATYIDDGGYASTPAASSPPTIVFVEAYPDGADTVSFQAIVTGNPAAGVQEVFVTYTADSGPFAGQWQSLDLTQDPNNSTVWTGSLSLAGTALGDIHYIAQAFNGLGLGTMAANLGDSYEVNPEGPTIPGGGGNGSTAAPTSFSNLILSSNVGAYGTQATVTAQLTSNGAPVAGALINFNLGPQSQQAQTDGSGFASVTFDLLGLPGDYIVQASFAGTSTLAPTAVNDTFIIVKQDTVLVLDQPAAGYVDDTDILSATLEDASGQPLGEESLLFVIRRADNSFAAARPAETNPAGQAIVGGTLPLDPGVYHVTVYFNGIIPLDSLTLNLTDPRYNSSFDSGTVEIFNTAPEGMADVYTTAEDTALVVPAEDGVLANDFDLNGTPLTAVLVSTTNNGSLTLNADGSFTYTPTANFNGSDSFTYYATDGLANTANITVDITVTPVNDTPSATADAYDVNENSILNVAAPGVLQNDSDADGDPLTAVLVSTTNNGALTLNTDGSFTYTPAPDYFGSDSFTYIATDGLANSVTTTVNITVHMVNAAPTCDSAEGSPREVWPLNKNFVAIHIMNVTDADNDLVNIVITGIYQDEEVGKGKNAIDGRGVGTDTAEVRAERDGNGDGRVYHVFFTASDNYGGQCTGEIRIPTVPHDQSGDPYFIDEIDGGALYDSTQN
ncbi:MAG: tandem-95 repeat protein, partial [Anaerolineales bacterium]|nr:tandem-95 repeat protein [Anaerolineales bacterium]